MASNFDREMAIADRDIIDEFGDEVLLPGAKTVLAIVDMPQQLVAVVGARGRFSELKLEKLTGLFIDADIEGLTERDIVSIAGKNMRVDEILPEGSGVSLVQFSDNVGANGSSDWQS